MHTSACEGNWEAGAVGAELSCADGSGLSPPPCRVLHTCSGYSTTRAEGSFPIKSKELQIFTQCVGPLAPAALCSVLKSSVGILERRCTAQCVSGRSAERLSSAEQLHAVKLGCEVCRCSGAHRLAGKGRGGGRALHRAGRRRGGAADRGCRQGLRCWLPVWLSRATLSIRL